MSSSARRSEAPRLYSMQESVELRSTGRTRASALRGSGWKLRGSWWRFGIEGLVQIDPEHAGEERDARSERQEQNHCPDDVLGDPPSRDGPEQRREQRDDGKCQTKADVHGPQKIPFLPLKLEFADGTALAHPREAQEDRGEENSSPAAAGTSLAQNRSQGRRSGRGCHRQSNNDFRRQFICNYRREHSDATEHVVRSTRLLLLWRRVVCRHYLCLRDCGVSGTGLPGDLSQRRIQ
jgi:hypothetical protein